MKKTILILCSAFLVAILVVCMVVISNPLRKEDGQIKELVLEKTPIGSSKEDVINIIEDTEEWGGKNGAPVYEVFPRGYLMRNTSPELYYKGFENLDPLKIVGKETIVAPIGEYQSLYKVRVYVYWAFDENGKLVDVAINREGLAS